MQVTWKRLGTTMSSHPSTPPVKPKFSPPPLLNFVVHPCPSFASLCESHISSIIGRRIDYNAVRTLNISSKSLPNSSISSPRKLQTTELNSTVLSQLILSIAKYVKLYNFLCYHRSKLHEIGGGGGGQGGKCTGGGKRGEGKRVSQGSGKREK